MESNRLLSALRLSSQHLNIKGKTVSWEEAAFSERGYLISAPWLNRVAERYISRILPLAFLAPDITEAILEGKQDPNLSLEKCAYEIPFEWALQRVALAERIDVG